jgi:thioredoxin reductase
MNEDVWDVVILGAGPAGLSAALMLGRCCRRVLVCDTGTPRNGRSRGLHGYLACDGIDPWELRRRGRQELDRYGIAVREVAATDARFCDGLFEVDLASGGPVRGRRLLIATGVRDDVPSQPGFEDCWGITVHHCPYCDGWESRGQRLAVYARGRRGTGLSLALLDWSRDVLLCTDGPTRFTPAERRQLETHGVRVRAERIERLDHAQGRVSAVVFREGPPEPRDRVFLGTPQAPQSPLAVKLGCRLNRKGAVVTGKHEESGIPGLYVAGDASRDVQLAIVAAAKGAKAAFAINTSFQKERLASGR